MILSDKQIRAAIVARDIVIEPFDERSLGTNSYDVHLGDTLKVYVPEDQCVPCDAVGCGASHVLPVLDCRKPLKTKTIKIDPDKGFVLQPGIGYLGVTQEYTETHKHVPFLDGKSSVGRLFTFIHCTAGRGDVGFCNHWTLELVVAQATRVYAGMPIGQLIYFETGDVAVPYNKKASAKYNQRSTEPQPSQMWKNFKRNTDDNFDGDQLTSWPPSFD